MRHGFLLAFLMAGMATFAAAGSFPDDDTNMFPFVISYDSPANAVDMRHLLDAPAGKYGHVFVKDGHFATTNGPIRFNGTNLTGPANMPSREYAVRMADRLARFGINCVRLHFLDCQKGYGSFMQSRQHCLLKESDDPFDYAFDWEQFDRLDFLVSEFKKRGIYVNLNLHVARFDYYRIEGARSKKGLTWLDRDMIDSQKRYARDFLTHRNPYTGLTWAEDPVVAMIELNNEDSVFFNRRAVMKAADRDFVAYMIGCEKRYLSEMHEYLRKDLNCRSPITGTQLNFGSAHSHAGVDYMDAHAYWSGPTHANEKWAWPDKPQVNFPEENCIPTLAARRCLGYPYTVSEYNNPYPNHYGTDGQILLRAYGAFQDWDGVFQYSYDNRVDSEPDHVEYFFSMIARTDVLAHFPACAALFLRRDVRPAKEMVRVSSKVGDYVDRFVDTKKIAEDVSRASGGAVPLAAGLLHGVGLVLDGEPHRAAPMATGPVLLSDTQELEWNVTQTNAGYFVVRAPQTKVFSGFVRGRSFDLGDGVSLSVGATKRDWATVSLVSRNATGFGRNGPANLLWTLTGQAWNSGSRFVKDESEIVGGLTARGEDWGHGPFMVEGVTASLTLPCAAGRVRCWALDRHGNRREALDVMVSGFGSQIAAGPQYKTVWYEILIEE